MLSRSSPICSQWWRFDAVHVRLYYFRVQTEAALPIQWLQITLEVGETSGTCASFCPLQNHQILGGKALKLAICGLENGYRTNKREIQLCWAESKMD